MSAIEDIAKELMQKAKKHNYGPNDSLMASIINNPKGLLSLLSKKVDTVMGFPDYEKANPYLTDVNEQAKAGLDLAGLAQTGAFPFAPRSNGGTLGTMTRLAGELPETEAAKAHAIAQKNAVEMLGLPPDNTAMDRAKAMGFRVDMPMYHGTSADFPEFNLFEGASVSRSPVGKLAVSLADNPALADEFAHLASQKVGDQAQNAGANVLPLLHRIGRGASMRLDGDVQNSEVFGAVVDAQKQGIDAIKIVDYITPSGKNLGPAYLIQNPNQIRSRFAAFDPAKIDSANLLASIAGITAIASQQNKDDSP